MIRLWSQPWPWQDLDQILIKTSSDLQTLVCTVPKVLTTHWHVYHGLNYKHCMVRWPSLNQMVIECLIGNQFWYRVTSVGLLMHGGECYPWYTSVRFHHSFCMNFELYTEQRTWLISIVSCTLLIINEE